MDIHKASYLREKVCYINTFKQYKCDETVHMCKYSTYFNQSECDETITTIQCKYLISKRLPVFINIST